MYPSTLKLTAAALTPLAALLGTRVQAGQIDLSTLAGTPGVSGNVRDVERIEGGEVFQVTSFAQNGKSAVSHRPALPRFQGT